MKNTSKFNNPLGFSLAEIMVVVLILSLIGLGAANLTNTMFSQQRRGNMRAVAQIIAVNLEGVLQNDTAWLNTINVTPANNAKLGCLRKPPTGPCTNTPVANGGPGPIQDFEVRNPDGTLYFDGNLATAGFDASGEPCLPGNNFVAPPAAGNSNCPFRYELEWTAECPATSPLSCNNPQVIIRGVLVFNPSDSSGVGLNFPVEAYEINIRREEYKRYEPVEFKYIFPGNSPGAAGECAPGTEVVRPLLMDDTVASGDPSFYDAGLNVANKTNDSFELVPGFYECKVMAQSYEANGGISIVMRDTTNGIDYPVGSGFSGNSTTVVTRGSVQFRLAGNTTFQLVQFCGATNIQQEFNMGRPTADSTGAFTGTVLTSISCVRSF
jgi:type II secretory pathway pseudopilin PulG